MISCRSATDSRSGSGDPGYSRWIQRSADMQKLRVELQTLYHERLRRIDQSDDSREEALQSEVGVLQAFVRELSEQNELLIQALEAEKVEGWVVEGRAASMQKELERRLSLALCPMPVDFVGTNTAMFLRTLGEQTDRCQYMQTQLPTQDAVLQQLKEAQANVEDREAHVQKLQDTITELHEEMTRMDQNKLTQLQELHQLESRVKQLSDQVSTTEQTGSSPVSHLTEQRSQELLKAELSHRDTTIRRLQQDLLLSHQACDSQTAQLDIQEQRISQLQTELHKSQLELQRGHGRREQQNRDLQSQTQQTEELRTQLAEVKVRLVQVDRENETLMGYKREQEAEVERLAAEADSLQSTAREPEGTGRAQAERSWEDWEVELAETRSQFLDRLDISKRMTEQQTQQFQAQRSSLQSQLGCVRQQQQDMSAEVPRLQRSMATLREREMEWGGERSAFQGKLSPARDELHSAILRVRQPEVRLQSQAVLVGQELLEERVLQDRELSAWRGRYHTASDRLVLSEAELEEVQGARDAALRSPTLQEEHAPHLGAQGQELQHSPEDPRGRLGQKEEMIVALRQQLLSSQDALQKVTAELRLCRREKEKLESRCVDKDEKISGILFDLVQLQEQNSTCCAQLVLKEAEVSRLRQDLRDVLDQNQNLKNDLGLLTQKHKASQQEVSDREQCLQGQEAESRLREVLQEVESGAADTGALTQSLDLYRTKYQACLTKISQQDGTLQALDKDLKEARAQVIEQEDQVLRLRAQAVVLQGELRDRCAQLDSGDDALSTLSQHLRDTQRDLEDSHKHSRECELVIGMLRDTAAALTRQAEEQEECVVKIQADFSLYKATHSHSDSDYNSQLSRTEELQQALSQAVEQCARSQEMIACQLEVVQLREEVSRLAQLNSNTVTEVLRLEESGRQLQAEAVIEEQRRLQEVGALEQKAARLEQDLQAAHSQCAQRQQAVQKRDALLRRSEADLLEARKALRSRAAEVKRQTSAARGLEADLHRARREGQQKDQECGSLRTQLMTLMEELKEAQGRCRDTAQELARQEEKVLLAEGRQHRAREHLAERVAELVRVEQGQRRQQAELHTLKDKLHTTEQELHGSRTQVEALKEGVEESRQAQLRAQQEATTLQAQLASTKDTLGTLQQQCQLREQDDASQALRAELAQEQARQQERNQEAKDKEARKERETGQLRSSLDKAYSQLRERKSTVVGLQERLAQLQKEHTACQSQLQQCQREMESWEGQSLKHSQEQAARIGGEATCLRAELARLKQRNTQLSEEKEGLEERTRQLAAELHRLQTASRQSLDDARSCEGRLAELSAQLERSQHWGQEQREALEAQEKEMLTMKVYMTSIRENYHAKVDALHLQLHSMNHQYTMAANKVEVLRQSLGNARSDIFHLTRESDLVITNINQWVKKQRQGNEKLNLLIKDQSKKIIRLTAEKDHLQESVDGLHREVERLTAELVESRMVAGKSQARVRDRHRTQARPPVQMPHTEPALTARGALSGPEDIHLCQR
ncbi:golgin subfamily A member 4 isoform X2 [Esox lucius]|uniref:golgin subfamily A member 4 isoform X2 n=1 Tax=Esox lucius TaxID=8010 RepID=UPI001476C57E|nr:golgin subfamily A member 4 isoform X2 [Esox lucius]